MKWFLYCSLVLFVKSQDFDCPSGKGRAVIKVKEGQTFSFNTNPDGGAFYEPKQKCQVTYRKSGKTCKTLKFSCSSVDIENKDASKCRKGSKLFVGKEVFCQEQTVDVTTTMRSLRIRFNSNKKAVEATGAQCTITCEGEAPEPTAAVPDDCKCGLAQRATRVVGGQDSEVNEWPWQAGLISKGGKTPWCGGTLVNSKWVLTAAHCTINEKPKKLQIKLGEHITNQDGETNHVVMDVAAINNHPDYNDWTLDFDFSMVQLKTAVDFSSYPHIRPACLPTDTTNDFAAQVATVTGWGTLQEGGGLSSTLQEVDLNILTNDQCKNDYDYSPSDITDSMLCANIPGGGADACQGDSGGPLVTSSGGDGVTPGQNYELIGVVSWGIGCARPTYPGVYARVTNQLSWIQSFLDTSGQSCPAS